MYSIYSLVDPRSNEVRYVGMSKDAHSRYGTHLIERNESAKSSWILDMRKAGIMPTLTILESDLREQEARKREKYWITYYQKQGASLTNSFKRPRKKEHWITGHEAATLLTQQSGHEVSQNYVRFLAYDALKIAHRARDGRTEEYLKSDVERITVRKKHKGKEHE